MAAAEWYCDADVIGLGHTLAGLRLPVTWPGDNGVREPIRRSLSPSPVQDTGTPDDEWIPAVARAGMAIITKDRHILERLVEIDAVVASRARMFVITTAHPLDLWGQVRVVAAQWPTMLERRDDAGPFVDSITLTTHRRLYPPPVAPG